MSSTKVKPEQRIIIMEDGTEANFGLRSIILFSKDLETNSLIFKLFSGKIIIFNVDGIDSFTEFQKQVYLHGLQAKIKSNIVTLKSIAAIEEELEKQISNLKAGKFSKAKKVNIPTLDNTLRAWAIVKSGKYPDKVKDILSSWIEYNNPEIVNEILTAWDSLTKKEKSAIKRNPFVQYEKELLDSLAGIEVIIP
jgi:hypothetical protein